MPEVAARAAPPRSLARRLTLSAVHLLQYHVSSSGSSSILSGGSRHIKWKLRGHPSQHKNLPIPRQLEQKSWLTKSTSGLPLPFRAGPLFAVLCTRDPTRRPRPDAEMPERTCVSPPRVGRARATLSSVAKRCRSCSRSRSRSRSRRAALGPTIVCTSALRSDGSGAEKMLKACPWGPGWEDVARELGAEETSREGVPVAAFGVSMYGDEADVRPRRGRVAAIVSPIGLASVVISLGMWCGAGWEQKAEEAGGGLNRRDGRWRLGRGGTHS